MATLLWQSALAVIAIGLLSAPAHSETLRLTSSTGADNATQAFVERIEKSPLLAAADLQIQIFPPGAIVAPGRVLGALENGTVDMALVTHVEILGSGTPDGLAYVLLLANPAIVASPREQFAIQDSVYGDKIAVELGKRKLVSLAFWNRSAVALLAKRPVKSLDDLKGQRIASFDLASRNVVAALGAQPTSLPAGDILAAVERGLLDASEGAADCIG